MKKIYLFIMVVLYSMVSSLSVVYCENVNFNKEKFLNLGDYISLGKYDEKPIVWRYVSNDENGKLILSDSILCEKNFSGNNLWETSKIRLWLNSEDEEGVEWYPSNSPLYGSYGKECGFLNTRNFTDTQKVVIKDVTLKNILDEAFVERASHGELTRANLKHTNYFDYEINMETMQIYDKLIAEVLTEKVFLLSLDQINSIRCNSDVLGAEYLTMSEYWWLRTPDINIHATRYNDTTYVASHSLVLGPVFSDTDKKTKFSILSAKATNEYGVRPAFYLNEENAKIISGSGTKEDPYVLDGRPVPERFEENGLYGYKDADGNVVVPAKYLKAWEFSEGAALVVLPEDPYRLRYIDTTGNYLFDKAFYASNNFNNGYALVLVADDPKYSYIDKTGEFATELLFDDAEDFCGGYARVQIDGKWGVVDTNFNFKVPCEYNSKDEVLGKLDLS